MASSSARDTGKQAADELTDPGYSEGDDAPVTLDELYEAVAELRGLVMVLAEPVILRLQAKEASTAKRLAASVRRGERIPQHRPGLLQTAQLQRASRRRGVGAGAPDGHRRLGGHPSGRHPR
jgi:hypothetical protein